MGKNHGLLNPLIRLGFHLFEKTEKIPLSQLKKITAQVAGRPSSPPAAFSSARSTRAWLEPAALPRRAAAGSKAPRSDAPRHRQNTGRAASGSKTGSIAPRR